MANTIKVLGQSKPSATTLTAAYTVPALSLIHIYVWFCINGTAAVPVGASFAAVTSELINGQYIIARDVIVGDVLHFFCAAAGASVSVSFYALMA